MNKEGEWNRREFIVKPLVWAGAAGVLGKTETLFARTADPAGPLLQRTLGKTGITLPIVSMGVMNADVPGLIRRSYELGIRHFDTAAVYQEGRNEEMVGRMIKEMGVRDHVIISTKQGMRGGKSGVGRRRSASRRELSSVCSACSWITLTCFTTTALIRPRTRDLKGHSTRCRL